MTWINQSIWSLMQCNEWPKKIQGVISCECHMLAELLISQNAIRNDWIRIGKSPGWLERHHEKWMLDSEKVSTQGFEYIYRVNVHRSETVCYLYIERYIPAIIEALHLNTHRFYMWLNIKHWAYIKHTNNISILRKT